MVAVQPGTAFMQNRRLGAPPDDWGTRALVRERAETLPDLICKDCLSMAAVGPYGQERDIRPAVIR